jgi:hypothetical protein
MARVALHAIQPARVNGYDRSLHVDEIVLAQSALPFARSLSATTARLADSIFYPRIRPRNGFKPFRSAKERRQAVPVGANSNECAIAGEYVQRHARHEFAGFPQVKSGTGRG